MKFSSKTEPTVKKMLSVRQRIVYLSATVAGIALIAGWAGEAAAQRQAQAQPQRAPREAMASAQTAEQAAPAAAAGLRAPGTDGTVVAIQPFQRTTTVTLGDQTRLWLTDINPNVRGRYLLVRQRAGRSDQNFVDIENPIREQVVTLGEDGLMVTQGQTRTACAFRTVDGRDLFAPMGQPITPFCEGRLLVRSQQGGYRTTEEAAVSLLRSMGGVGESLINIYKTTVGQDANLERAGNTQAQARGDRPPEQAPTMALPRQAPVDPDDANSVFAVNRLSVQVARPATRTTLHPGVWYPATAQPGVAISLIAPGQIDATIMQRNANLVHPLDDVESDAIVYLMAFDTATYTLDYRVGTDHPGVEWSSRPSVPHANPNGPDGFENIRPLARVGMVPPQERPRLAAVFVGGFKRDHGAFRYGRLASVNNGSHYGFVENGVVLSRLVPGLSTLIGRVDGTLELRSWTEQDDMSTVVFARQNGMPIVETDANGNTVPGSTIRSWGVGNWSGALVINRDPTGRDQRSADLRTLRSGICMQTHAGHTWMIYAYFTAATPSAMARVFQAYGCSHAMMLDMNAPELTYAALYGSTENGGVRVEHLNNAMLDTEPGRGRYRFLSANDNRDFFAVLRRQPTQASQAPAQAAAQPAPANAPAPATPPARSAAPQPSRPSP